MGEALPVLVSSVALVVIGVVVVGWSRKRIERIRKIWRNLAESFDGTFVPASGSIWNRKSFRVEANIGGIAVCLDSYVVSTGKSSVTYTRTTAPTSSSHRLKVYKSNMFTSIGKAFGLEDHIIGDADYDDMFIIKSDDGIWVAKVLDATLRREHLRQPKLMLKVEDGQAKSVQVGFDDDIDRLTERMKLTAAISLSSQR